MKAALAFPGFHRRAGVERIMVECARHLVSQGHEVTILAHDIDPLPVPVTAGQPHHIHYHQVPVRQYPAYLQGSSFYKNCTRALPQVDYEVLNTHGCVCPTGGVHWVQSVHRSWLNRSKELRGRYSLGRLKQVLNPLHPMLLKLEEIHFRQRRFQRLIATTEDVRSDLHQLYEVPLDQIEVIPNGFSPVEFNPERRQRERDPMRRQLGLHPEHIALLFVANELERKGYRTILAAMRELQNKNLRLIVAGRPSKTLVMQLAEEFGVAAQVIAHGPSSDVGLLHAAADLFVLPTQYEAFCLAILESLGSGLPVITSRVPGAHDAIQVGRNGALVTDPKDGAELAALLKPLLDQAQLQALSASTPATVTRYQWPVVLAQYEKLLQRFCK